MGENFLTFDNKLLSRWLNEYGVMCREIRQCIETIEKVSGLSISCDESKITEIKSYWLAGCKEWLDELEESDELSHKKLCAVLLAHIITIEPFSITEIHEGGDAHLKARIIDGKSPYLGWLIIHEVCNFYEIDRDDLKTDFVPRINVEFETDFMSNLVNGYMNERSIHIALKGLYLRD